MCWAERNYAQYARLDCALRSHTWHSLLHFRISGPEEQLSKAFVFEKLMQALQENDMRLSRVYEVDEPSVVVHSIADVCQVECPDGSTCFFDYNANAFACNAIVVAAGDSGEGELEREEEEMDEKEASSEWPIADIPSTTARLDMQISTTTTAAVDEAEEVSTSTSTSGQFFAIASEQSEMVEASTTDEVGRGRDGTTTSERTGILPASADDEDLSVVDVFPESGREDDASSVDAVTLPTAESTTMPTSTITGVPSSTTVDPSPTTGISDRTTEELMSVEKTTPRLTVENDESPVARDSDPISDADPTETGTDGPPEVNDVSVEASTLSLLDRSNFKNETQISVEEVAAVPDETDGAIEEVTTESPMTSPAPITIESAQDTETAEETYASKEVVTRGPDTDFTTVAEPGFIITASSIENEQTEQPKVSTLSSLIETTAESESKDGMFGGVTQGFESINGESEETTEAQQRVEMTTRLSKVLNTTLQSITESILGDENLTEDSATALEDALTKAITEISTSTSTSTTTEPITSEERSSSVDLSIPIIKDPAEVEQKLQELVANVTKQFKVTTQAYGGGDGAAAVTESSISSVLNEAVTMLVPGFVSTAATTEDPVPAAAVATGGAVDEDKITNATDNAAVPRNLQLNESEELHNALVTERTNNALANECEALGMFSCGNGCVRREKRCDLIMDCEDGSDEIDCGE